MPGPTAAEQFQNLQNHPITVELPESGVTVKVKRPTIWDLVREGRIPDHLANIAANGVRGLNDDGDGVTGDDMRDFAELVDAVVCASLIDPPVSPEGPVTPDMIPWVDRQVIYAVISRTGGGDALARFRDEPGGNDAPRTPRGQVEDTAVPAGGVPG